jgi:hypothetical protein
MSTLNQETIDAFLANEVYKDSGFQNIGDWEYIASTDNYNLSQNGLFSIAYKNVNTGEISI